MAIFFLKTRRREKTHSHLAIEQEADH